MWFDLATLFDYAEMPTWRSLIAADRLHATEPKNRFFISHKWETTQVPDPSGRQWRALQSLFVNALRTPPTGHYSESTALIASAVTLGSVSQYDFMPPMFLDFAISCDARWGLAYPDSRAVRLAYRGIEPAFRFFGRTSEMGVHIPVMISGGSLSKIGFWLDYCCLPQGDRSAQEQAYFISMMPQVISLASRSTIIGIWSKEEICLRRAWCLVESAVNYSATKAGPVISTAGKANKAVASRTAPAFANPGPATGVAIAQLSALARRARTADEVLDWLMAQGANCTLDTDLNFVAAAMFSAAIPEWRIGLRAASWSILGLGSTCVWILLAVPLFLMVPLRALIHGCLNGWQESPKIQDGWLSKLSWFVEPLLASVMAPFMIAESLWFLALLPIEMTRRLCEKQIIRERSSHIGRSIASVSQTNATDSRF
jgi:hypothetical protein